MAANPISDFDLGPLTWVKTEIDHSLNQARENLEKLAGYPDERAPVRYILTHLHQATGALAMVGLAAATRFNEELEKLVASLETADAAHVPGTSAAAKKGISALSGYLDELLSGAVDTPMRLLPAYIELNRARGASDANEGDLFYPNLAAPLPVPPGVQEVLDDAILAKALAHQRSQYQQGLLKVLRGTDPHEALSLMQGAVAAIETLELATANRAFWSAAAAFFDALAFDGLAMGPAVKPLFAKVDQQLKQMIEGSGRVSERLFRDLLLQVGRSRPVTERIAVLKEVYRLESLLSRPDQPQGDAGDEALTALLRELRELTTQQKDTWLKFTSGNRAALEPFGKQSLALAERAARLPQRDLQPVLARLSDVAPSLKARAIPPSEAQALEVATALLFVESSLENYFKLGADFGQQAKTVTERLKNAMAGEALAPMDAQTGGFLDEMTRRAQEKLLVFQVGQEVQVNLQNIEQSLDAFFRDAAKRPELKALPGLFAQVQGALMIMELNDAAGLNAAVMARVQQFADGSLDGTGEAAEMVADGLSALGLYVTAMQQGAANPREVLAPALVRFGLLAPPEKRVEIEVRRTGTVSPIDIEVQKQKVQALYEDWREKPEGEGKRKLERAVTDLQRDAAVVSDNEVAKQSGDALKIIQQAVDPSQTGVFRAMTGLAPEKAPQMPTAQVVQLVDAPGAEIDKELLEIFLEEAVEVIATIATNLAACRAAPHGKEALTTIRRGFHTLKGSGRMVGLVDLGEMAWQCEQVLNKWLKEEKPATVGLLGFVDLAQHSFGQWIANLRATGNAGIDGAEILRQAEMLKNDQEPTPFTAAPAEELSPAIEEAQLEDIVMAEPPPPAAPVEPAEVEEAHAQLPEATRAAPAFAFESLDLAPAPEAKPELPAEAPPAELEFASLLDGLAETPPPATPAQLLDQAPANLFDESPAPPAPSEPEVPTRLEELAPVAFSPVEEPAFVAPDAPVEEAVAIHETPPGSIVPGAPAPLEPIVPEDESRVEAATAEPAPPEEEPDVVVGDVAVSPAFFAIYLGEAEQHAVVLEREMALLETDPANRQVSHEFMRAAHTLTSSSRTTGFHMLADVAHALEKWLADAIDFPPQFTPGRMAATRRAVDALVAMVGSIRGRSQPHSREDVIEELQALCEGLRESRRTGEGTHIKMPGVIRDAIDAQEVPPARPFVPPPQAFVPPPQAFVPPARIAVPPPLPVEPAHAQAPSSPAPELPESERPFEAGKEQRKIRDDLDRDLLPVFLEEARELIPQVSEATRQWRGSPGDHAPAADLRRLLHTLKGSARMTGLMRLGELAHVLESRIVSMEEFESAPAQLFDEIEERVDRFSVSLERLARGEDILDAMPIDVPVTAIFEQQKDKPRAIAVIAAAAQEVAQAAQAQALPPELREARVALLRVNADLIDRFVNEAGELSIARSRIEGEMAAFKRALVDLSESIARMRAQLREIEIQAEGQMQSTLKEREEKGGQFDPLEFDRFTRMQELTRFLAESLADVITLQQSLTKNIDETELAIHAQGRLNRELQQGLMGVRLVPLSNLADRFYRVVRSTAKELDKKANLELKGVRVELDRSVLEKITAPFEHLLRNAVGHGLESPRERVAAGKEEIGEIAIDAVQRGNEVVLTVSDDGAGLDYPRIRAKAIEAGLLARDVELPDAQLAQFIFTPGFSTASEITQLAGRGIGMDIVKNEITTLGGRVEIASTPGRGTVFTITLPLTLAVTQAVMLRAGQTTYAVPSVMIEQVQEYKSGAYAMVAAAGEVRWKDNAYPLRSLLPLLGEVDTATPARKIPVLLLKSGLLRAAVRVDEIIGNREVVVKTIGPQLSRLAGIAGATVLGNGQVVLILNPVSLVHRGAVGAPATVPVPLVTAALVVEHKSGAPLVMVVDDSLTVRKITSRMLAREGYEFITAKDGVDALQQLQEVKPDCILLDVEMPRMDGFEFARNVRADPETKGIPIIMITSRSADKHRNHALELGVNEYMGKPYQEEQLLALIKRFTDERAFA